MTVDDLLSTLRAKGWRVAVHNDYTLNKTQMTFWLFTKAGAVYDDVGDGVYIKGEGETDLLALIECAQKAGLL